jgi:hypothetical protein
VVVQEKLTVPDPVTEAYWFNGLALLLMLHDPLFVLGRIKANWEVKVNEPVIPA